jgi:hypothetical protein
MRSRVRVLPATLLAACAAPARLPPGDLPYERQVAGCWIERAGAQRAITMRLLRARDGAKVIAGRWRADIRVYGPRGQVPERAAYDLAPGADGGWEFCAVENPVWSGARCRPAFFGAGQARDGGWVELLGSREAVRVIYESEGGAIVIFEGRRDGCD